MPGASLYQTLQQTAITASVLHALHACWPQPTDLAPSAVDPIAAGEHQLFVRAVHDLVAEGLVTIELLLIGSGPEPVACGAMLTQTGLALLDQVTRPM